MKCPPCEISGSRGGEYDYEEFLGRRIVSLKQTDVSEVRTAFIIRAKNHPDDWGSTYLWNVCLHQWDCAALSPRNPSSSSSLCLLPYLGLCSIGATPQYCWTLFLVLRASYIYFGCSFACIVLSTVPSLSSIHLRFRLPILLTDGWRRHTREHLPLVCSFWDTGFLS
jgi:hypothetical protein